MWQGNEILRFQMTLSLTNQPLFLASLGALCCWVPHSRTSEKWLLYPGPQAAASTFRGVDHAPGIFQICPLSCQNCLKTQCRLQALTCGWVTSLPGGNLKAVLSLPVPTPPSPTPEVQNPRSFPKPGAGKALSVLSLSLDAARAVGRALGQENELLVWWGRPGSIPGRKWGQGIGSSVPGVNQLLGWEGVQVPGSHPERQRCIALEAFLGHAGYSLVLELNSLVLLFFKR